MYYMKTKLKAMLLIMIALLVGCSSAQPQETVSASESLEAYLTYMLHNDSKEIEALSGKTVAELGIERSTVMDNLLAENLKQAGFTISEDVTKKFMEKMFENFDKMKFEIVSENVDNQTATVKLKLYQLDISKQAQEMQNDLRKKIMNGEITDLSVFDDESKLIEMLIEYIDGATLKSTPVEIAVEMEVTNEFWLPSDKGIKAIFDQVLSVA